MNFGKRTLYRAFVCGIKVYQRLFLNLQAWGRENIPAGAKIYVTNHISSTDPYWVLPIFNEPVHIIIGPGYQSRTLARLLDYFEQINAMPQHRRTVVDHAVRHLTKGESVYTAPEGDIQEPFHLGRFYPGVARIYRQSRAPIIPIALVAPRAAMREWPVQFVVEGRVYRTVTVLRGPYSINIGEPFTPQVTDDGGPEEDQQVIEQLKQRMRSLIEDVRTEKFWFEG